LAECLNFDNGTLIVKSHENNAVMWPTFAVDFLSVVLIVCNQYPVLGVSFLDDVVVTHPAGLIVNRKNLMLLGT